MPIPGSQWAIAMLPPKRRAFVMEYLIDFNGTQAYLRAGYKASESVAAVEAVRLLRSPKVQAALAEEREARSKRCEITQDRVLLEIARIAFSDIRKAMDENGKLKRLSEMDDDLAPAISKIKVTGTYQTGTLMELGLWDKNSALEKLCKHLGLTPDHVNLNVNRHEEALKALDEPE